MSDFLLDVLRLTAWLALLVAIFVPIERLFAAREAKPWRPGAGVDLAWYFVNSLLPAAIIALPLALLARGLDGLDPLGIYSAVAGWPLWARLIAALLVNDIGAYWMHRWQHRSRLLWRFHAVHHSAEHIDWLVNTRAHPIDMVLVRLAGLVPVYLLGLAQAEVDGADPLVLWVTVIGTVWSFFIHANVRWRFGPLERLISTPAFHHWHHTNDADHRDRNFAAVLPILDRLFGTRHLPDHLPPVYGIDGEVAASLGAQFVDPFIGDVKPRASKSA